jgi:hypothetical protein
MMVIQGLIDSSQDLKDKRTKQVNPNSVIEIPDLGISTLQENAS